MARTIREPVVSPGGTGLGIKLRPMVQGDLPDVVFIEQQTSAVCWTLLDFLQVLRSSDTLKWVALKDGVIGGFAISSVPARPAVVRKKRATIPMRDDTGATRPQRLTLRKLAVAPAWRRQRIGQALLLGLHQLLNQPGDCIEALVPESSLTMQLFLRSAGYRAVRVLRRYFGREDAYQMRWQRE